MKLQSSEKIPKTENYSMSSQSGLYALWWIINVSCVAVPLEHPGYLQHVPLLGYGVSWGGITSPFQRLHERTRLTMGDKTGQGKFHNTKHNIASDILWSLLSSWKTGILKCKLVSLLCWISTKPVKGLWVTWKSALMVLWKLIFLMN